MMMMMMMRYDYYLSFGHRFLSRFQSYLATLADEAERRDNSATIIRSMLAACLRLREIVLCNQFLAE
jgi:hypothetical protein